MRWPHGHNGTSGRVAQNNPRRNADAYQEAEIWGILEKCRRGRDFPSLVLGAIMKDKSIVELLAEIESRCEQMKKEVEEARKFDWNVFLK